MPERGTVVVTGAARGIGRATALRLARAGFALGLVDREAAALEAVASEIEGAGHPACAIVADAASADAAQLVLETALQRFGRIDGLAHIAGVGARAVQDILDVTRDDYDRCADVNARAVFFMLQRFARHFVDTPQADGHRFMIVVTSSNATALSIDRAEYCVSKSAAAMATQLFAARLAPHDVAVFEIRPGVISTGMTASRIDTYRSRIMTEGLAAIPRVGEAEDVAQCIETAALGLLPYTVGQVINVDGGLQSRRY
jgi:3-oxoacyl-[acyl-carrier protein] reductase